MNLTPMIRSILSESLLARDSDSELILQVLLRRGFAPTKRQEDILRDLSFESIRRTRQKLQQAGEYLPSLKVARQRRLKSMIMQQSMPTASVERTEKLIKEQPKPLPGGS